MLTSHISSQHCLLTVDVGEESDAAVVSGAAAQVLGDEFSESSEEAAEDEGSKAEEEEESATEETDENISTNFRRSRRKRTLEEKCRSYRLIKLPEFQRWAQTTHFLQKPIPIPPELEACMSNVRKNSSMPRSPAPPALSLLDGPPLQRAMADPRLHRRDTRRRGAAQMCSQKLLQRVAERSQLRCNGPTRFAQGRRWK